MELYGGWNKAVFVRGPACEVTPETGIIFLSVFPYERLSILLLRQQRRWPVAGLLTTSLCQHAVTSEWESCWLVFSPPKHLEVIGCRVVQQQHWWNILHSLLNFWTSQDLRVSSRQVLRFKWPLSPSSVTISIKADVLSVCGFGVCQQNVTVFPEVDVPGNLPQSQTVQCSEKLQRTRERYLRHSRPRLAS